MNNFIKRYFIYIIYAVFITIEAAIWLACGTAMPFLPVMLAIFALAGVLMICFAYSFAKWNNKWYSRWHNKHTSNTDDRHFEPSAYAIFSVKISGYILIALFQVIFCVLMI